MAEIGRLSGVAGQDPAHFDMSRSTATDTGSGAGLVEIDPAYVSVRFTGNAAQARRSVILGGKTPITIAGTCKLLPIDGETG